MILSFAVKLSKPLFIMVCSNFSCCVFLVFDVIFNFLMYKKVVVGLLQYGVSFVIIYL